MHKLTPHQASSPPSNGGTGSFSLNPYGLATLAAQLICRQSNPSNAVETAWGLLKEAERKLERVRIRAQLDAPEAEAEWQKRQGEKLEATRIPYEKGVRLIAGVDRWSGEYGALSWLKRFLRAKIKSQGRPDSEVEPRVEAWLAKYRSPGFTGTEAKKFQEEYHHWRNKGKQGRVKKRVRDGRLGENRQRKAREKGAQAWKEFQNGPEPSDRRTKPELEFTADIKAGEAMKAAADRGKTPVRGITLVPYDDVAAFIRDQGRRGE
jgi:hypothetical protein